MNILDLPIEKQEALAKRMGMTHAAWVNKMIKDDRDSKAFIKHIESMEPSMSPEEAKRFQEKVDSGNPL